MNIRHIAWTVAFALGCGDLDRPMPQNAPSPNQQTSSPEAKQTPNDEQPSQSVITEVDAVVAAEKIVRANLKFPDDASFPSSILSPPSVKHNAAGDMWSVEGKVVAANGLGARLTYPYFVILQFHEDSTTYEWSCAVGDEVATKSAGFQTAAEIKEQARKEEELNRKIEAELAKREREEEVKRERERKLAETIEKKFRMWTSGNYTVEARVTITTDTHVWLKKRDGKTVKVEIEKLSEADQEYLANKGPK